ncbi:MAG: amino acid permease-domain-containing protein [Benniella sp.]|nr:MAG: amino acid permease-domain-containing protein [Benniella sp.]
MYHDDLVPNYTASPIAAAICRDTPLRPLPSGGHYHYGSANYSRFNTNIISSIHDLDLYEDGHHAYDAYGELSVPRAMKQAPKLLTLDDYNFVSLGYKPVMSRRLPWVSLTGTVVTAANIFSGIISLYGMTVVNGGPAWATWSYVVVGLMSTIVTLCLSELASAYPTTAGVHHWAYQLGPAKRRAYLSWMAGWYTIVTAVSVTASLTFYFSSVLGQLLVSIRKTALMPATIVMFHLGVLFAWQMFNLIPSRGIGHLSILSGFFITALAVALVSAMLSLAGFEPLMAHIPFTAFLNYSGSSSAVYAALSSMLMTSFIFCPQDTVIRMAEESRRPEKTMARLMVGSSVYSLLMGLPLIIVLNYGIIKPVKGILDATVPGVRVILETLGNSTGTVFVALILVAMFCTGVVRSAMAARIVYTFARGGGVPHSFYWNHLHPRRKTLGCITANISFVVPLWMRLTNEGNLHFTPGKFQLGRYSRPLHIISVTWLMLLSLFLMFPSTFPLTKNNFNYAPVVLIVLTSLFSISWLKARTDFTGGAKDVSRASHRTSLRDAYPLRQQQQQEGGDLEPSRDVLPLNSSHQLPTHSTLQKFKVPEQESGRYGFNIGVNLVASAVPSRNTSKKQPLSQSDMASACPNVNLTSRIGPQRGQVSNMTFTSATSDRRHPSSILGVPFSESPETVHRELMGKQDPSIQYPRVPATLTGFNGSECCGAARSPGYEDPELLLTRPVSYALTSLPEIYIAPPTTDSTEASASAAQSVRESAVAFEMAEIVSGASPGGKKAWKAKSTMPSQITVYPRYYPSNDSSEESPASDMLTARPLNAIDSIFSLADMDDGALSVSDYTTPTIEDEHHLSPAMPLVMLSRHKKHGSKSTVLGRQEVERHEMDRGSECSIEDMIGEMNAGSPPSPSRTPSLVPTLDGYPLIRSSSGSFTEGIQTSWNLCLSDQLPLSRTLTIRYCEQEYGASFKLGDSDDDEKDRNHTNNHDHDHDDDDDDSELYNSKSCLNSFSRRKEPPYSYHHGTFAEADAICHEEEDEKEYTDLNPSREYLQQSSFSTTSTAQQQRRQQQQQRFQRSSSVAHWAREQALLQVKRIQHKARLHALQELRKQDPTATLSIHSSNTSEFSYYSTLSSWSVPQPLSRSSSSSSGAGGGASGRKASFRRTQNWVGGTVLELLHEDDEPLETSHLAIVIREREDEQEEMPGLYMDTDDIMSPSIEVESLGAGVGKSPFKV